jgi:hypothetical protein
VLPDGGLRVSVAPGALTDGGAAELLLRLRRDPEGRQLRAPFAPVDVRPGSRRVAVVDRAAQRLPEGRWDCYVTPRGRTKGRRRLRAELVEQAALLTLPPVVDARGVSAWIPYTTSDGFLAVRAWQRPAHAEVERVHVGDTACTVTAVLLGRSAPGTWDAARLVGVPRDAAGPELSVPVEPLGGERFRGEVPSADAAAGHTGGRCVWDLTLVCEPGADPVPLGRITGDGVSRKKTDVFPAAAADGPDGGPCRVRTYFTAHQMLALALEPVTEAPAAPASVPAPVRRLLARRDG